MQIDAPADPSAPPNPYRERRGAILLIGALAFAVGILETLTIVSLVGYIDLVATGTSRDTQSIGPLSVTLDRDAVAWVAVVAVLGVTVTQFAAAWVKVTAATRWQLNTQKRSLEHYLRADWATQSRQTSGRLNTTILEFSWAGGRVISGLGDFLNGLFGVLVLGLTALVVEPFIALILAFASGLLALSLRPITRIGKRASAEGGRAHVDASSRVIEMGELARDIRLADVSSVFASRVGEACEDLMTHRRRAALASALAPQIYRSLGFLMTIAAVLIASRASGVEIARVGVVGLLLLRSVNYGQRLQSAWQNIVQAGPFVEQLAEWWEELTVGRHRQGTAEIAAIEEVRLAGVSYAYGDGTEVAVRDLDLDLRKGEMVGVVGPTGSGKSTLAQLLLGLRRPTSGAVTIDGVDSTDLAPASWHRRVGLVPQDPHLVSDTVLENIRFYRAHVSDEDARKAAEMAGLRREIEAMPHGYETLLGGVERDVSGGQRQRLGIARALAGSPQLLILDEPTSALDVLTERQIQGVLDSLRGTMTVVIIAHRLSTLRRCDRILVMADGRLEMSGSPEEVLAGNEFYRSAVEQSVLTAGEDAPAPKVADR